MIDPRSVIAAGVFFVHTKQGNAFICLVLLSLRRPLKPQNLKYLMKNLFSLIAGLFLLTTLYAQKADVKWGPGLESETSVIRFLAEQNGKYFTLSGRKDNLYLERYNSLTFKQEFSKMMEVPKLNGKEQEIEAVIFLQNKFFLFTSQYSNKLNSYKINAYSFSSEGILDKEMHELLSIEANSSDESGTVSFLISEDSTRILMAHYAYFRKTDTEVISMTVLDEKLTQVTKAKVEFPAEEDGFYTRISNYALNNLGEIFLLRMEVTAAVKKTPAKTVYTILSFDPSGERNRDFPIDLEGKRIDKLSFGFDVNQNLLVSGFYEGVAKTGFFSYGGLSGTFFMSIDKKTGEEKAKSFQDFGKELFDTYFTPKQREKGTAMMLPNDFVPRQIVQKADGGVVSVYEQYSYSYSQGQSGSVEVTYYGDLLVTNINPDGTIKWVKLIPKRQIFIKRKPALGIGVPGASVSVLISLKSDQTIYYSYLMAVTGDKIVFVFNDEPENQEIKPAHETAVMKRIKGTIPMIVSLTEGGEMLKKSLFAATDFDIIIRPRIAFQSSDTRILIYGSKGDLDKFGVLTIE